MLPQGATPSYTPNTITGDKYSPDGLAGFPLEGEEGEEGGTDAAEIDRKYSSL